MEPIGCLGSSLKALLPLTVKDLICRDISSALLSDGEGCSLDISVISTYFEGLSSKSRLEGMLPSRISVPMTSSGGAISNLYYLLDIYNNSKTRQGIRIKLDVMEAKDDVYLLMAVCTVVQNEYELI